MKYLLPAKANILKKQKEFETIFETWLEQNLNRFIYKPIKIKKDRYSFEGIVKNIQLSVCSVTFEISLFFYDKNNRLMDICSVSCIYEKYNPLKGYYDSEIINKNYNYYNSKEELYINDMFEPLLEYANKIFIKTNKLYLFQSDGYTEAFISTQSKEYELENIYELFI